MDPRSGSVHRPDRARLSRRALLGSCLAGAALAGLAPLSARRASSQPETWHTWLLASADELRPAPPPEPSAAELDELLRLQALRSATTNAQIRRWGVAAGVISWLGAALDLVQRARRNPVRAGRALALLHAAIADTLVAVWDAKATYYRERPAEREPALLQQGEIVPGLSTFPSEHAAVAGAAGAVLTYLFPEEPAGRIAAMVSEAANSRIFAGANYRSDVDAGLAIGRAVGERAVARGRADGSAAEWDGRRPEGEGFWVPTPPRFVAEPLEPVAGRWQGWVAADPASLRPAAPPAWGTPEWREQLAAVQRACANRTPEQAEAALFWAGNDGTVTPAGIWLELARDLILRDRLDAPHTARVLALTAIAMADAFICCWDTKYTYWTARPITADPTLDILFPTPPFPSFTSGHATVSGAAAAVLGGLFPADAAAIAARAEEAKDSRLWSGFHYPIDNEMGLAQGRAIGGMVLRAAGLN